MVPLVHASPHPKRHLDRFSCSAGFTVATDQPTDRQTETPRYSVCNNRLHLHCSGMQPNNKLCNIVVQDGTIQSHNINEIYNVHLYQATNFLNAPRILHGSETWPAKKEKMALQ